MLPNLGAAREPDASSDGGLRAILVWSTERSATEDVDHRRLGSAIAAADATIAEEEALYDDEEQHCPYRQHQRAQTSFGKRPAGTAAKLESFCDAANSVAAPSGVGSRAIEALRSR